MTFMTRTIAILLLCAVSTPHFAQDAKPPLRNQDVVKLLKAKLPESTILLTIETSPSAFDTSAEELIKLKESGVPTRVIEAMLQATARRAPARAAAPAPAPQDSATALTSVQASGGFAGFWGNRQTRIDADRVFLLEGDKRNEMKFTRPGTRTRVLFAVQQFAVLGGNKARTRTLNRTPEFEMILPNNIEVSSVVALGLLAQRPNGSREILIGAGYISVSQGLPGDRNMRLTYDKAPDQSGAPEGYEIYRIKPAEPLQVGEYAFMVNKPAGQMGAFAGAGIAYNFYELGID